jgi:tight adherence protein C
MGKMFVSLMTVLACVSAGVAVFCISLFLFRLLEQLEIEKKETSRQLPLMFKMMMPFTGNVDGLVRTPFFDVSRKTAGEQILMAGFDQLIDEHKFVAVQVLLSMIGIFFAIAFSVMKQPFLGIIFLALVYLYPKIWLKGIVRRRHHEIQKALPNVLDLLTLSVEAGKDFLTSLRDILSRRRSDALGEELERTFREIQLGKQRRVALKELSKRVQQPDLSNVLNSIVQADELGVSIGQILRIQGDQLRNKRFNRAEKLANEAPVKILFPLVLFILPSVIIILMGPLILKSFNILFK